MRTRASFAVALLASSLTGALGSVPAAGEQAAGPQSVEIGARQLAKYAAFAKVEANMAEASAGLFLQQLLPDKAAQRAMEIDDYMKDFDAVAQHLEQLEGMELTEAERQDLDRFKSGWAELMELRAPLMAEERASPEQLLAYWEKLAELDDIVDDVLARMVPVPPTVR